MNKGRLLTTLACAALFLAGFLLGGGWNVAEANAVEAQGGDVNGAWEIYHGRNTSDGLYAIKHNRLTGETLILNTYLDVRNESWIRPPVKQ